MNGRYGSVLIFPKERDPRLITIRRGGSLTDEYYRLLADWALSCAEHVLHLFEDQQPAEDRPRDAIDPRSGLDPAVRCVGPMHAKRLSRPMPRRAACPTQRSSLHCRRARRPRCLTSPPMTWALPRTPSGRPVHPSQPTTLRKLGPRNVSGSGTPPCRYPRTRRRSTTPERHLLARVRRLTTLRERGRRADPPSRGQFSDLLQVHDLPWDELGATVSPNISMDRLLRFRRAPPSPLSTSTPVSIHGQGQRSARSQPNDHNWTGRLAIMTAGSGIPFRAR